MRKKILETIMIINIICVTICTPAYADDKDEEFEDSSLQEIVEQENVAAVANQENNEPNLNSRIAVAYDRDSDMVIWGKNENKRSAMASTTKIMTAIVLLENTPDLSKTVTISRKSRRNWRLKTRTKKERHNNNARLTIWAYAKISGMMQRLQ